MSSDSTASSAVLTVTCLQYMSLHLLCNANARPNCEAGRSSRKTNEPDKTRMDFEIYFDYIDLLVSPKKATQKEAEPIDAA